MFNLSINAIKSQLAANFEMVSDIVQRCPEEFWISSIEDHVIGRVIYHGLFYIDFYYNDLDITKTNPSEQFDQSPVFEDLIVPKASLRVSDEPILSQGMILEYIEYLGEKCGMLLEKVTEDLLKMKSGFNWLPFTKYETLIYALRHLMEHTGQVIAYMRSEGHIAGRWVGVGEL